MSDLSKVPFLANLEAADLEMLAQRMEKRTYDEGDLIYADGTPGEGLYYIESGTVTVLTNVSCDSEIMAHLPKGSTFGETALLNDRPHTTAVRAASDCTIMVLPRSDFQAFLTEHPVAGQIVTQALTQSPTRGARQLVAEVLKPMPLFVGISDDALLTIARKLHLTQVCDNSVIYSEGQTPDALYLVESGAATLLTSEATGRAVVAEIDRYDFFGEDALLTYEPREIAAIARGATDLWELNRTDFEALVNEHPAEVLALTRALATRSERFNRQLLAITESARPARPAARSVVIPRQTVVREPLLSGLRAWVGGLSLSGKLRLALIGLLVAWLALVTLPSVIAGGLPGATPAPAADGRGASALQPSSRGGAIVRGPDALNSDIVDIAEAPLARMSDLVTIKPAVVEPTAAPAAVAQATAAAPSPTAAPAQTVKYAIASGDTISAIASRFKVSADVLAEANGITNPALINVDQVLTIPGGDEQVQIAAKLAAAPVPTPAPVAAVRVVVAAAAPVAAPAAAPVAASAAAPAGLPFTWDGRLDKWGIHVEPAAVAAGQPYYRLVKALFRDTNEPVAANLPGGDHNIYIDVVDENGKRLAGAKAIIRNGGTANLLIENKPFPEYGSNFPMYGMMGSYTAFADGLPSDQIIGMGLPMKWHVSYFLTFQRTTK